MLWKKSLQPCLVIKMYKVNNLICFNISKCNNIKIQWNARTMGDKTNIEINHFDCKLLRFQYPQVQSKLVPKVSWYGLTITNNNLLDTNDYYCVINADIWCWIIKLYLWAFDLYLQYNAWPQSSIVQRQHGISLDLMPMYS